MRQPLCQRNRDPCLVPCYLGAGLLYYRKALLHKYNFKPPRSWTDLLPQGQLLKGKPIQVSTFTRPSSSNMRDWSAICWNCLGSTASPIGTTCSHGNPCLRYVSTDRYCRTYLALPSTDRMAKHVSGAGASLCRPDASPICVDLNAVFQRNIGRAGGCRLGGRLHKARSAGACDPAPVCPSTLYGLYPLLYLCLE